MARPRIHPEGTTAAERVKLSVAALTTAGGARKSLRLSPDANAALKTVIAAMGFSTETAAIEAILIDRANKLKADGCVPID